MSIKKRGGIWFVRVGSVRIQYTRVKRAPARPVECVTVDLQSKVGIDAEFYCTMACGVFALWAVSHAALRLAAL